MIKIEYLKLGRCSELLKIGRYVVQDTVVQDTVYWVTVHNYPLTSYILQCCPLRDFGGKQFHLILDIMCPRSNQ